MSKKEAWKSTTALSPIMCVFFPMVKSSFFSPNPRAVARERGSSPKVHTEPAAAATAQFSAGVKAAGFQNGVVVGLKLDLLVCGTPATMFTRDPAAVTLQPPNETSPAVPWQFP